MNDGINVVGADVLDWMNDIQDYDGNGDPVGEPYRPLVTQPLARYSGHQDWLIT